MSTPVIHYMSDMLDISRYDDGVVLFTAKDSAGDDSLVMLYPDELSYFIKVLQRIQKKNEDSQSKDS